MKAPSDSSFRTPLATEERDARYFPSEYCNQRGCDHPPAACQRKSIAVGPGGCPPCPESLPSLARWYHPTQRRG